MIISNNAGYSINYSCEDKNRQYNDGGTINAGSYVEFAPRGDAPYKVLVSSITLQSVPSPAVVVSFWGSNQNGAGYSQ